jgi:hypothetical protein
LGRFAANLSSAYPLLFDYTLDEPLASGEWSVLVARSAAVHQADPKLRVLCTIDINDAQAHLGANATAIIDL